jgi:hypothetical protein
VLIKEAVGSGFIRVPYPRRFDMPQSKSIEDDPEEGEIYSLSVTHQLHCLVRNPLVFVAINEMAITDAPKGIVRDVIKKYEKKDRSRFAGGHEYHCIDYSRFSNIIHFRVSGGDEYEY